MVTVSSQEGQGSTFTIRIPTEYPPAEDRSTADGGTVSDSNEPQEAN
jgi:hypothetical protein